MVEGTTITGGVASTTMIANPHDAPFPLASIAVHWTQLLPRPNIEPDGGTQTAVRFESQLSVTATVKVTTVPAEPAQGTVIVSGHDNSGASLSMTLSRPME